MTNKAPVIAGGFIILVLYLFKYISPIALPVLHVLYDALFNKLVQTLLQFLDGYRGIRRQFAQCETPAVAGGFGNRVIHRNQISVSEPFNRQYYEQRRNDKRRSRDRERERRNRPERRPLRETGYEAQTE